MLIEDSAQTRGVGRTGTWQLVRRQTGQFHSRENIIISVFFMSPICCANERIPYGGRVISAGVKQMNGWGMQNCLILQTKRSQHVI